MAKIRPFKGTIYNKDVISDLKDVTTPPYDVITPAEQDNFYKKSEHNVIRLILGKKTDQDSSSDNRYTRSATFLNDWLTSNALIDEKDEAIYVYKQDYTLDDGTVMTRTGFIALTRLEDFSSGKILPHEKTLSGPRADRLRLMESCHSNFSQIFSLYSDKELTVDNIMENAVSGNAPDMDVTDDAGITHRIFKVTDPEAIKSVVANMDDKRLFIADGHHRYETALNFRNLNRKNGDMPEDSPYNFVMMYFANMDSEGLVVFPTHRVLFNLQDYQVDFLKSEICKFFTVTGFPFSENNESEVLERFTKELEKAGETAHAFGMYIKGDTTFHLLVADCPEKFESILSGDMSESLKGLDVTVLHSVLIDHLLGVGTAAQEKQQNLKYVKSSEKAIDLVKNDDFQVAFLLNPTKVEQVKAVASAGEKMPQKSTFFYPKLLTGLVINRLNTI